MQQAGSQARENRSRRARGEQKREHRAHRQHRRRKRQLRHRATTEQHLHRSSDVVVERRAVVDEISDRNITEQDLPAANHVEEVIVGEPGERPARIVEAEEPRGDENADRERHEDRVAEMRRDRERHRVAAVARGAFDNTICARPRVIGVWRVTYHFCVASRAASVSP